MERKIFRVANFDAFFNLICLAPFVAKEATTH